MIKDKNMEELFKDAQNGNMEAREAIVKQYMGLVYSNAKKYAGKYIDFEDAVQISSVGLLEAIQRFDIEAENEFSTYAVWYIKGKLFQSLRSYRKDVPFKIPRKNYYEYKEIKKIRKEYENLQREPTIKELAKEMKITVQEVSKTLNLIEKRFGLDSPMKDSKNDSENRSLSELLINPNELTEDQIVIKIVIQDAIKKLPNRQKQVIELRFIQGKSQEAVGKELGVSQPTVGRAEKAALKNLKVILNGEKVKIETQDNKVKKYKIDVNKTDLSCLSERQRQVVLLVHGEGLSFAETGRRLGITRSNAYSTMRDVYKKLEKNS